MTCHSTVMPQQGNQINIAASSVGKQTLFVQTTNISSTNTVTIATSTSSPNSAQTQQGQDRFAINQGLPISQLQRFGLNPHGIEINIINGKEEPELPRPTLDQLREMASGVFKGQIQGYLSITDQVIRDENTFAANRNNWNKLIIPNLGLKDKTINGAVQSLSPAQLMEVRLKALIHPNKLSTVFDTIPNKHFESVNKKNAHGVLEDWEDTRFPKPQNTQVLYGDLENTFRNFSSLNYSTKEVLKQINLLEESNWTKRFGEFSLFGYPKNKNKIPPIEQYVYISVSPAEKEKLIELRNQILDNQKKSQKAHDQVWNLGEILRSTKTVRDIIQNPLYIKEKLFDPAKLALRMHPEYAPQILAGMKNKIMEILVDATDLQTETFKGLDNQLDINGMKNADKALIRNIVSQVADKVLMSLEISNGRLITEEYGNVSSGIQSPLGGIFIDDHPPKDKKAKDLSKMKEAKNDLYALFKNISDSKGKLTFASLVPVMAKFQEGSGELIKNNNVLNESASLNNKDYDKNVSSINYAMPLEANKKEITRMAMEHPVVEITRYTKMAFDQVFRDQEKFGALTNQLGFIPFEMNIEKQMQLEVILNTNHFRNIFKVDKYDKYENQSIAWSPALLSRIMFLYYQFQKGSNHAKNKEEVLSQINL
jgi:hypothetical protein